VHDRLQELYDKLYDRFGPGNWWPADTPFEVIVGAILTQNTAWTNVEKALNNLKSIAPLTPELLWNLPETSLKQAIRPAGYYNQKAKKLRAFLHVLFRQYDGDLEAMFTLDTEALRQCLLEISGIGPETADSILLYAAERPVFVIDRYTIRALSRHAFLPEEATYPEAQQFMTDHLPEDTALYNEFHALFVELGKNFCKPRPLCSGCPLEDDL
jgi:endonuclease-3 related protein